MVGSYSFFGRLTRLDHVHCHRRILVSFFGYAAETYNLLLRLGRGNAKQVKEQGNYDVVRHDQKTFPGKQRQFHT
jgi:hypothetical protein